MQQNAGQFFANALPLSTSQGSSIQEVVGLINRRLFRRHGQFAAFIGCPDRIEQGIQVQVGQSFVNTGSRQMEVSFCFPLPYDGAIDQMTFLVDGQELEGRLLEADKAVAYGVVVTIMADVKRAGFDKLGMITQPAEDKR